MGTSIRHGVTAGITASVTQTQGNGALTTEVNEVSTVANANDTVTLPTAAVGWRVVVINNGANTLQIFPASGDNLGAGVDTAMTLANGSRITFHAFDATNWEPESFAGDVSGSSGAIQVETATTPTDGDDDTSVATTAFVQNARHLALAVADLGDTATPSVLTTEETTNKLISNYQASGADHVFTMPAAHTGGNVTFFIGDEFQVDIEPNSSDLFYLNGTAMAADEHIQNTADTLGDTIVGICANVNGTLRWIFRTSDANWVEQTP
jgi:hypothetical protein